MILEISLLVVCFVLIVLGLVGTVIPIIPGPILSYIGYLILHSSDKYQFSTTNIVVVTILVVVVTILDYVVPILGTKKFGGSKMGAIGSTVGLILGLFFAPIGIILGPFLGAFLFELMNGKGERDAFMSGLGSFVGFLFGTLLKISVVLFICYLCVAEVITKI